AQGAKADTAVQPGDLAAVATSGDYGDLTNKPTLPTKSALVADVTLSGNGTENIVHQITIPANTLAAQSVVRVTMFVSAVAGGQTALTPRLRLGATGTTADLQVGNGADATVTPNLTHSVWVEFLLTLRVPGGAGVATANC